MAGQPICPPHASRSPAPVESRGAGPSRLWPRPAACAYVQGEISPPGVPPVTQDTIAVRACVFDAYGTLFDFASAAARCSDVLGDKAAAVTALGATSSCTYTWLRGLQGRHADFWQVTGDALDFTLETLGIADPAVRDRLMGLYRTLDRFPEVPDVLRRLKEAGFATAILSNGSPTCCATRSPARASPTPRPCPVGGGGRRVQAAPAASTSWPSTGSACRRAPIASSPPTPGMPTRPPPSACAWCGATATASAASACRGPRPRDPHACRAAAVAGSWLERG